MNIHSLVPMQLALAPKLDHKTDLRIADILSRLRTTFADKGFDGASMQDLARAAGISVGSFYRYFPSKSDIIAKMISVDMDDMQAQFAAVTASPHPMNALRALIRSKIATAQLQKEGQLWAEIAAMSCRNAQIGVYSNEMETAVAQYLTRIFAIDLNISPAISARLFAAEAAYIMLMVRSAATLSPHGSATLADVNALILRSIDHTLDTISAYHADASKRDLPPSSGSKG